MAPYLLVLAITIFWIGLEKKLFNRDAFWVPIIILSLFAGIRHYSVGTDSPRYASNFIYNINPQYIEFNQNNEIGYQFYNHFILNITHNYFWLFFISALIVCFFYLKIIKIYSDKYWLSILLFICLGTYTFFFNGLRQGLAMAIFALALPYLLDKKPTKYLITCFIASLFHTSAIFMIPFYFLVNLRIKLIYKLIATLLTSFLTAQLVIAYLAKTNQKYEGYTEISETSGGTLTSAFYIILAVLIFTLSYFYKIKSETFKKLFTLYSCGLSLLIPIILLGTHPSGPQRLLFYFNWVLIFLFPTIFKKINNSYITYAFSILMIIYFTLITSRFSDLTPYTTNPIFHIF